MIRPHNAQLSRSLVIAVLAWRSAAAFASGEYSVAIESLPPPGGGGQFVPPEIRIPAGVPLHFSADSGIFSVIQADAHYDFSIPVEYCLPSPPNCNPLPEPWVGELAFTSAGDYYFSDPNHADMHLHVDVQPDRVLKNGFETPNSPPTIATTTSIVIDEDAPSVLVDVAVADDSGAQNVNVGLERTNETADLLLLESDLVSTQDAAHYTLKITPQPNLSSGPPISDVAKLRLTAIDREDDWTIADISVEIRPVNDAPTVQLYNPWPLEHPDGTAGLFELDAFLIAIPGPFGEEGQTIHYALSETDPNDVVTSLSIDAEGSLSYTLSGNSGQARFDVHAVDDGGTLFGGQDTSEALSFTISVGMPPMSASSGSFTNGGTIPLIFTCDSPVPPAGISPNLNWANAPVGTGSFTIIAQDDYFALGVPHWIVHNLPTEMQMVQPGQHIEQISGVVSTDYYGPCPPSGDPAHLYSFHVYAMDSAFNMPPPADPSMTTYAFEAQYGAHILAHAHVAGTYVR